MKRLGVFFGIFAVASLVAIVSLRTSTAHRLDLRTYFRNAAGLNPGAAVRIDGVNLGIVSRIRVRPELGDKPVEIDISLHPSYNLAIPNDSTVLLVTDGVLGPKLVDIDTRHASGPPLRNNGALSSLEPTPDETSQSIKNFTDSIGRAVDKLSSAAPVSVPSKQNTQNK